MVRRKAKKKRPPPKRDRSELSPDELRTLEEKVLPRAREWVASNKRGSPLYRQGIQTLNYWGWD
jgi:hypothetical protein